MSDQIKELLQKVDSLEKQISLVQNNVNFSLGLTWTILGVVVAIVGVALYFLAKTWVDKRVDAEIGKLRKKFKYKIDDYNVIQKGSTIELEVKIPEENINKNYPIYWSIIWKNPFFHEN